MSHSICYEDILGGRFHILRRGKCSKCSLQADAAVDKAEFLSMRASPYEALRKTIENKFAKVECRPGQFLTGFEETDPALDRRLRDKAGGWTLPPC